MKQSEFSSMNDKALTDAIKDALDQSTLDLDAETLNQLRQARFKALEKKKVKLSVWTWPTMAAAATLAAFIILPTLVHKHNAETEQAKIILDYGSEDEVTSVDDIEMLEDMDLIQALSEEEGEEVGNEQT